MRARIGRAVNSSDLLDHVYECDVDVVGALAFASMAGSRLLRGAYGLDAGALRSLVLTLTRRAARRRGMVGPVAKRIAIQALREYVLPRCRVCLGAREQIAGSLRVVCPLCEGSGLHRYSDRERAEALGESVQDYRRHYAASLTELVRYVASLSSPAVGIIRAQLES